MDQAGLREHATSSMDVAGGILTTDDARGLLFDEILKQLALCDPFSNTALGLPSIFPVYAHENKEDVAVAHADCVSDITGWLTKIKAGVLWDRSPLPRPVPKGEDTSALRNILANQIRLLPIRTEAKFESDKAFKSVDKVIVCGSEVLQQYCETNFAVTYIKSIVKMWNDLVGHPMEIVKSKIENFVHISAQNHPTHFHHVLTEIAFLQIRRLRLPERHGMIPVSLDGGYNLPYLSTFWNTDLTLKLKPTPDGKHQLFLNLIEQLFVGQKDLIQAFKKLYGEMTKELKLNVDGVVSKSNFQDCLHSKVTRMYHEYWSIFATAMHNGGYVVYAGKVGQYLFRIIDKGKENERREILNWVSPMAAATMHGEYHDGNTQRLKGTCDWIIQDERFRDWHKSAASAILSLCGSMGMGKTYATSRVTDWVKDSLQDSNYDEALAYFYCIKNDENRNNAKVVLRSILRQIATGPWNKRHQGVALDVAIIDVWNKHKSMDQFCGTFDEWRDCLFKLLNKYPRVTIVLDALDECGPTDREQLVDLFTAMVAESSNVRIFVSTRPESDLLQWLGKHPSITMHKGHTAGDITAFVQKRITRHGSWRYLKREHQEKITRILVDKSLNMFLFAKLQMDSLNVYKTRGDIESALEQLPSKLKEAYALIYNQATKGVDAKRWVDRALRWVMCSAEPLTSEELLFAISQGTESNRIEDTSEDLSEELLSDLCNNLLSLDSSANRYKRLADGNKGPPAPVWRLAHQAVEEYFRTPQECASMHFEAGRVCLMILLDTFGGPAVEEKSDWRRLDVRGSDYQCPCRKEHHSEVPTWPGQRHVELQKTLAAYATHAWPTHVSKYENHESHGNGELSQLLLRFIDDPKEGNLMYTRWLEHTDGTRTHPGWSVVYQRQLCKMNDNMSRVCFASYLGFPKTLAKWLDSSGLGQDTRYHAVNWSPWSGVHKHFPKWRSEKPLWWSLAALASAHDEVKVLEYLSSSQLPQQGNECAEDEVPPIIAAAIGDSVGAARKLIKQSTDKHSALATRHGHVLRFSIHCNSLEVLKLLLDEVLDKPRMVNEILPSVQTMDFQSAPAITMLLAKGVDVNTSLADGTLLAVAAYRGWGGLVYQLLIDKRADVNTKFEGPELRWDELERWGKFENALEASFCNNYESTFIPRLLIENGAHVDVKAFDIVWSQYQHLQAQAGDPNGNPDENLCGLLRLLVSNMSVSELHETWERGPGLTTSVLIQLIQSADVYGVQALTDRRVDVNQLVGGQFVDAVNQVFNETMSREWHERYPTGRMIEILRKAGANFQNLDGKQLNIALAAAAWSGLDNVASVLLDRNADPNASCEHQFFTALGAAAASEQPRAPDTVGLLLLRGVDVNFCFSSLDRSGIPAKFALDYPLWLMIDELSSDALIDVDPEERLYIWARSASILLKHGAIWDVDFGQWRICLQNVQPEFSSHNVSILDEMQEYWERNRKPLSDSDLASEKWRIKDPTADSDDRVILRSICDILRIG